MKIHREHRAQDKKKIPIEIVPRDQTNTQENLQDMDQNQNVDVKPAQFVSVTVNNQIENYTGKITGYVHKDTSEEHPYSIQIALYFANHRKYPIYQKVLDKNMDFVMEELPPGFYMIELSSKDKVLKRIPNIKVLPNQTVHQSIILE
ncbi:hypothetical protein [Defluviitalea saccharophila]|uniref:Carboxypeptidase regulatory-like domain-containing protein n=1 Tax=Defluviitalea saccharophila TaxID=879970 RepID=A0ABZ2Y953_9FIRM